MARGRELARRPLWRKRRTIAGLPATGLFTRLPLLAAVSSLALGVAIVAVADAASLARQIAGLNSRAA